MFYEGDTIYSYGYHFPIARKVTAPNGETVILFTTESYSVSTAKHKTIVRRAIGYHTPNVLEVPLRVSQYSNILLTVDATVLILIDQTKELADKWTRARSNKSWYAARIADKIETANRLIECWQLDRPRITSPEDIGEYVKAYQEEERRKQIAKDNAEKKAIREWVQGASIRPPHTRIPYVRVKENTLETSWGIKVPLREALPVFRLAKLIQKCGSEWCPTKYHAVGGWRLDRITADGTVRAGCHAIPFKVQLEAAKLAGLA
jgi:hypothetical protein